MDGCMAWLDFVGEWFGMWASSRMIDHELGVCQKLKGDWDFGLE